MTEDKTIDVKLMQAQTVVLLGRQYLLTEHLIESGASTLREFELAVRSGKQELSHVLKVYNYVFALIDHLVRFHKIAFSLPGFNHKSSDFRALSKAIGNLKAVRNQLQHINNDIMNDFKGPLLGSVCWASGNSQYMTLFHDIGRQRSSYGIVFDVQNNKHDHDFCYVYNEHYYSLGDAIEGMRTFQSYLDSVVQIQIDGKDYDIKDHFAALCIEIKDKAAEST